MKLDASSCRGIAWEGLKGRWGHAVITGLVASLLGVFTGLFSGMVKIFLFTCGILYFCQDVPLYRELTFTAVLLIILLWVFVGSFARLGYIDYNLAILDQRKAKTELLFSAGAQWWKSFGIRIVLKTLTLVCGLFALLPGFIFSYSHAMAPFLLEEMEDLSLFEAMRLSRQKMKGYRLELFFLRLSFLPWYLLGIVTLGIGFLWLRPYISLSETVFFNEVSGRAKELYGRDE